jgi:TPR repeat protein
LILAVVWWRRSAADNVATAQCNLGTMPFLAAQGVAEAAAALRRLRIAPA